MEETFLAALHADPCDETTWLALADWLDDDGQTLRAELVRLLRRLGKMPVMKRSRERLRLAERVAELLNSGVRPVVPEVVNSIGMRLALIPPGRFRMGSPTSEAGRFYNEGPLHEVEITRPFYLGVFPVTQAQWQTVMGNNPSWFSSTGPNKARVKGMDTGDFPVENVSWTNAMTFLKKLSARPEEKKKGRKYRLPTEAEWEYACRGGASSGPFHFGTSLSSRQANFAGTHPHGGAAKGPFLGRTCQVGSYRPNAFGLYDVHGNVSEWCSDWYAEDYYGESLPSDPPGPSVGSDRVIRGGSLSLVGRCCRSAVRCEYAPGDRHHDLGFRAALGPLGG